MKKFITSILEYLAGKKTSIATIIGALITYSLTKGLIDADLAQLLSVVLVALGLSANIASAKLLN
jgi:hypothetical protein